MMQLTQWIDPYDKIWCNKAKKYITNAKWLDRESVRIQNKKKCNVVIKTNSLGHQAIFREKLK
tara:strand:+ start:47 stop:235 length:189 start_codon:yes stop_codon:yes gene_type:complete